MVDHSVDAALNGLMKEDEYVQPPVRLYLRVREDLLPRFSLLTGGGFIVCARTGRSIRDLLCGQLGVPPDYLEKRIQTIFLNGRVVDDPQIAIVRPDSTIALSATMPGIAGAMFRRGSAYAVMRSRISHADRDADRAADGQGRLVIKLFNAVQAELGPRMLHRGVQIPGKALCDLFRGRSDAFRSGILTARIEDAPISPHDLLEKDWKDQDIVIQVRTSTAVFGLGETPGP